MDLGVRAKVGESLRYRRSQDAKSEALSVEGKAQSPTEYPVGHLERY
jgi:hypothetical protein